MWLFSRIKAPIATELQNLPDGKVKPANRNFTDASPKADSRLWLLCPGRWAEARARDRQGEPKANCSRDPSSQGSAPLCWRSSLTFSDLVVKVNGVHGSRDDVGLAVTRGHDPSHLVHELHGDPCREGQAAG